MIRAKSLPLVFIARWFAGLLYLPRIVVNFPMAPANSMAERERLSMMSRKPF